MPDAVERDHHITVGGPTQDFIESLVAKWAEVESERIASRKDTVNAIVGVYVTTLIAVVLYLIFA